MNPTRTSTPAILAATGACFLAGLAWGLATGDLTGAFHEGRPGTIASILLLLLTAATVGAIWRQRRRAAPAVPARRVWLAIALGFGFLALDEGGQIHENLDKLIHSIGNITETPATDRIDDVIILGYGLIGAAVLLVHRAEILRIPGLARYLGLGLALMAVQVLLDAASNGDGGAVIGISHDVLALGEEAAKLFAEAVLLAGFVHAWRVVQEVG